MPAAEAPAKYVIEVQRYLLRQVTHRGSSAFKEVCTAAMGELATYWTSPHTHSALNKRAENSPCVRPVTLPKSVRKTQTVTSVEQAMFAALKRLVKRLKGRLPRREPRGEPAEVSAAARSTPPSPPEGNAAPGARSRKARRASGRFAAQ